MGNAILSYVSNLGIALSQLLHTTLGGNPDITLSAATHVRACNGSYLNAALEEVIDLIIFWDEDHCAAAYTRDKNNALETLDFFE